MNLPSPSTDPAVIRHKSHLAQERHPASWTDPQFERGLYVEAKVSLLLSIMDYWQLYRRRQLPREQLPRVRDLIRLKITAYRFFDACRLAHP